MISSEVLHCSPPPLYLRLILQLTVCGVDFCMSVTFSERTSPRVYCYLDCNIFDCPLNCTAIIQHYLFSSDEVRTSQGAVTLLEALHSISDVCRNLRRFVASTYIHSHINTFTHTCIHSHINTFTYKYIHT